MTNTALRTQTLSTTKTYAQQIPKVAVDESFRSEEYAAYRPPSVFDSIELELLDFVRSFVTHLMATNSGADETHDRSQRPIDWELIRRTVADSCSVEHAIGRAVVIADQMSRGVYDNTSEEVDWSDTLAEDPFFAFSVAEAVPDFGDQRRYRTRVTRTVARIFKADARS